MAREVTLTEVGEDRYEVHRDRVPMLSGGSADLDYAKDYVARTRTPDEKVILVEKDGYRTDITHDFERRNRRSRR